MSAQFQIRSSACRSWRSCPSRCGLFARLGDRLLVGWGGRCVCGAGVGAVDADVDVDSFGGGEGGGGGTRGVVRGEGYWNAEEKASSIHGDL